MVIKFTVCMLRSCRCEQLDAADRILECLPMGTTGLVHSLRKIIVKSCQDLPSITMTWKVLPCLAKKLRSHRVH